MKIFSNKKKAKLVTTGISIFALALVVFSLVFVVKSFNLAAIVFSFGKSLKTDNFGHTNIVLAGIGGEGHDGGDLTDTLMMASIDHENKTITMLSIPRDLYVKSGQLKSGERINEIYSIAKNRFKSSELGMEELKNVTAALTGIRIDYFIRIDFKSFKKLVDSIGGVNIMVEKDIYDPYYPLKETVQYEPFAIKAGLQHMDGEIALKYARSRKTTSDFDRAHRQQQLLTAIKEKALSLNLLTNPSKIQEIYAAVNAGIETDLSVNEIITLAKISTELKKQNVHSFVLGDNPNECGGFLYTPAREFFNGAYVLLPAGNSYDDIHLFTRTIFDYPQIVSEKDPIQILNGTKKPNIASEVTNFLSRMCFNVIHYSNAENRNLTETTIYFRPLPNGKNPKILDFLQKFLPFKMQAGIPSKYLNNEKKQQTSVVVELGEDYMQKRIPDPFLKLFFAGAGLKPAPAKTEN